MASLGHRIAISKIAAGAQGRVLFVVPYSLLHPWLACAPLRAAASSSIFAASAAVGRAKGRAKGRAMATSRASQSEPTQAAAPTASADHAPLQLEHFLPYQLNVVASLVSQALSRVYVKRHRIGVPEWRVLVALGQHHAMTGKAIGALTHMHKTKVSRAVAILEKRKLLVRRSNRSDMRESFLSLSASGRAMYEELAPHALEFAKRLTEILSPADREAFDRAVKQLAERSAELVAEAALENEEA
jgi:DNA-binding MarR family transcriptional regulator